jgi:hypothetical protein
MDIKPNFAIKRSVTLFPLPAAPEFGWSYAFQLPQDCILVLATNMYNEHGQSFDRQWRVEGDTILSQQAELKLRYIHWNASIESLMDSAFAKCVAAYLASEIAYALTESSPKMTSMYGLYEQRKTDNYHINGMESSTVRTLNDQLDLVR